MYVTEHVLQQHLLANGQMNGTSHEYNRTTRNNI